MYRVEEFKNWNKNHHKQLTNAWRKQCVLICSLDINGERETFVSRSTSHNFVFYAGTNSNV